MAAVVVQGGQTKIAHCLWRVLWRVLWVDGFTFN
jgi:hypothetical protein